MKGALVAVAIAILGWPLLRSRPGKIVTVAIGPHGELLSNAEILIDAQRRCTAGRCTFEAGAGVHEVTVRADGYLSQLQLVAIDSGEAAVINFRLERGGSSFDVSGHPEGASLVVDGRWIGRLPLNVDVPPGVHRVRVEAERFRPEERLVEVSPGETKKIGDIALLPRLGTATVDVRTPDTQVSLVSGSERIEHLELGRAVELDLSRQWTLVATREGFQTLREPIVWDGVLNKTIVVTLERTAPATAHR